MDILEAFQKLDDAERFPAIAVLCTDMHHLPRSHPEETLAISAVDRINSLEHQMANLTNVIEDLVSAEYLIPGGEKEPEILQE